MFSSRLEIKGYEIKRSSSINLEDKSQAPISMRILAIMTIDKMVCWCVCVCVCVERRGRGKYISSSELVQTIYH